jgi:uncharacterized protein (DUF983 family)
MGELIPLSVSLEIPLSPEPHPGSPEGSEPVEQHVGDVCPHCGEGCLDYDGMLNLVCDQCGYTLAGCFT